MLPTFCQKSWSFTALSYSDGAEILNNLVNGSIEQLRENNCLSFQFLYLSLLM